MPLKLHVIPGTPAPDTATERVRKRVRVHKKPAAVIDCHRCGGREVIETRIGLMARNRRASGGTRQYLCALCFMRGERVVLL